MTVKELIDLTEKEEVCIWDFNENDFYNYGKPLSQEDLEETNLLEREVLSIEIQDDDIVANIDTSLD